jgi:hypothetical protein
MKSPFVDGSIPSHLGLPVGEVWNSLNIQYLYIYIHIYIYMYIYIYIHIYTYIYTHEYDIPIISPFRSHNDNIFRRRSEPLGAPTLDSLSPSTSRNIAAGRSSFLRKRKRNDTKFLKILRVQNRNSNYISTILYNDVPFHQMILAGFDLYI